MKELVSHMFFPLSNGRLVRKPFQCGIIVSIRSTLALFEELKQENIDFLLTTRVNQDCIENLFSCIRSMGGNGTHPTPIEAVNRIRKLCLTKSVHYILDNANVEQSDQEC